MPKRQNKKIPLQTYKNLVEVMSKANNAFYKVLKENKRLDIPTPFL